MTARRLYVFDIDGTLINTGGAGSSAMRAAFTALWGVEDGFAGVEFAGRTDRAILRDGLAISGFDNDAAFESNLRRFKRAYLRRLGGRLAACEGEVLPGVVPLLQRLQQDAGAIVGLATGNFRAGAAQKLRYYGLDAYFSHGGFGDSSDDRAAMVGQAIRAGQRRAGRRATVYVIGDTVHDVAAAKANHAVAVGVATGPADESVLAAAGADIVLPNLEAAAKHLQAKS